METKNLHGDSAIGLESFRDSPNDRGGEISKLRHLNTVCRNHPPLKNENLKERKFEIAPGSFDPIRIKLVLTLLLFFFFKFKI